MPASAVVVLCCQLSLFPFCLSLSNLSVCLSTWISSYLVFGDAFHQIPVPTALLSLHHRFNSILERMTYGSDFFPRLFSCSGLHVGKMLLVLLFDPLSLRVEDGM